MKRLKKHLQRVIMIAIVIVGIRFAQDVQDAMILLNYHPSPAVARLATTTTMTDTARRLFYVNQPTIETTKSALNLCSRSEHTIILGCYVSNQGIFIKSVTNPSLSGVMEVTAAHEMLHVVYHRMSLLEQSQLDRQLHRVLEKLDHPRILKMIRTYQQQDPNSVNSELHSIFGTELRQLTPELEAHYRKYFTNRLAVVALSERYEGVFTALKNQVNRLDRELTQKQLELDRLSTQVKQESLAIASERSNLQTAISVNPQGDYHSLLSSFNDRVNNYNQLVSQLQQQANLYNRMVEEYNSLSLEQQSLFESLDNKSTQ